MASGRIGSRSKLACPLCRGNPHDKTESADRGTEAKEATMPLPANVENLLKQCDTGVAALKIFTDNKIDVETTTEGAIAFFDPGTTARKKKVVLNTSKPAAMCPAYFCP